METHEVTTYKASRAGVKLLIQTQARLVREESVQKVDFSLLNAHMPFQFEERSELVMVLSTSTLFNELHT